MSQASVWRRIRDLEAAGVIGARVTLVSGPTGQAFPKSINVAAVRTAVTVPVIASGGAGSVADCVDAFAAGGADAVLAASIFHREEISVATLKRGLADAGVDVLEAPIQPNRIYAVGCGNCGEWADMATAAARTNSIARPRVRSSSRPRL